MTDQWEVITRNIKICIIRSTIGYIEGIIAPDGEEQDAYILGVDKAVDKFTGKIIAVVHRIDDVEEKWVVALENMTFTKEEINRQIYFQEQYFNTRVIVSE